MWKDAPHCKLFSSVQSLSRVQLFAIPWTAAPQNSLSITNPKSLLKLMSIESVMPSNHFILCRPLLLPPSIFPSTRVFSNESALCIRWPKYWNFSFSISPSSEYSGLISFRMDWLDLLAVQQTLKSLLQYHSWKAPILWHSAFFIVQLSHSYMTTGKTIALTRQTFVDKVMSLLFNMLSRLVITFLHLEYVENSKTQQQQNPIQKWSKRGFPGDQVVQHLSCIAGDEGSIPSPGRARVPQLLACALESASCDYWAHMHKTQAPRHKRSTAVRGLRTTANSRPCSLQIAKACTQQCTFSAAKQNQLFKTCSALFWRMVKGLE